MFMSMTKLPNNSPSITTSLSNKFDRRNSSTCADFPLIDSNGNEVLEERRKSPDDQLKKIQLQEIHLTNQEFKKLFN